MAKPFLPPPQPFAFVNLPPLPTLHTPIQSSTFMSPSLNECQYIASLTITMSPSRLIYSLWQLITFFPGMVLIQLLFLTNRAEKWLLGLWLAAVMVIFLMLFSRFFFELRQCSSNNGGQNNGTCIQLPSVNTDDGFESASV